MAVCSCSSIVWAPASTSGRVKSIAIGIFAGLLAFGLITGLHYVLSRRFPQIKFSQDAQRLFNLFKKVHPVLDMIWRAVWRIFVVFLGPVLEEAFFRGFLNEKIKEWTGDKGFARKVLRVAVVALLFGVAHLSPFQNRISNLLVFGVTAPLGLVFGLIREARKDLLSPAVAHITYNLAATL